MNLNVIKLLCQRGLVWAHGSHVYMLDLERGRKEEKKARLKGEDWQIEQTLINLTHLSFEHVSVFVTSIFPLIPYILIFLLFSVSLSYFLSETEGLSIKVCWATSMCSLCFHWEKSTKHVQTLCSGANHGQLGSQKGSIKRSQGDKQ